MQKRMKFNEERGYDKSTSARCWRSELEQHKQKIHSKVVDYSDSFTIPRMLEELDSGKYGSATKDIEDLISRGQHLINIYHAADPTVSYSVLQVENYSREENLNAHRSTSIDVIDVEDDHDATGVPALQFVPGLLLVPSTEPLVILDSDDEELNREKPLNPFREVVLPVSIFN